MNRCRAPDNADRPAADLSPCSNHHVTHNSVRQNLTQSRNPARSQAKRLQRLEAPGDVISADSRKAAQWILRALRVERGLAVRGAAQYSFTRHVSLLRALDVARRISDRPAAKAICKGELSAKRKGRP
jgi:hypothetical protein